MSRSVFVNVVNVTDTNRLLGTAELTVPPPEGREHSETITLTLPDGRTVFVPHELLTQRPDGTYHLPLDAGGFGAEQEQEQRPQEQPQEQQPEPSPADSTEQQAIPVLEERFRIDKFLRDTSVVRVRKVVREHEETVDVPVIHEEVDVQRTPIEQFIDAVPPVRHEGDDIIIPVVEEVLVVEKRLMLQEELRISRRRVHETSRQQVTLRSEEPVVERETNPQH